jgi:hypothetical protein
MLKVTDKWIHKVRLLQRAGLDRAKRLPIQRILVPRAAAVGQQRESRIPAASCKATKWNKSQERNSICLGTRPTPRTCM